MHELAEMSLEEIDTRTFESYGLKEVERVLVEDFFEITLQDFKGNDTSPGRQRALLIDTGADVILGPYCKAFITVLRAAFGPDKAVSATIFSVSSGEPLAYCLVAFHLHWPGRNPVVVERLTEGALVDRLYELDRESLESNPEDGGVFYQRVARLYQTPSIDGNIVPTVYMVKPNQVRYWTRSAAYRDADEVAADIFLWDDRPGPEPKQDEAYA